MPELPEVEVIRRQLELHLVGATIQHIWIGRNDIVRQGLTDLPWYTKSRIVEIQRFGKSVALVCEQERTRRYLVAELGMTGLLLFDRQSMPSEKHLHVIIHLASCKNPELYYWNARRFGRLSLLNEQEWEAYRERRFGLDPLQVSENEFFSLIKGCRGRVKSVLLNQQRIAGIGNIYANEMLFRSGIHPDARGHRLSKKRIQQLFLNMQKVLNESIDKGGSSIRDYLSPNGSRGQFQHYHQVYQKTGQPCPACATPICRLVSERSSFVCASCQKR
ncbi:bifunctional DNA-formamidopyrimidine glycosylase/DNA-(apurinic or apyrimidinic site) lyase [Candidatus Nitronereus thalassa]|uniref:Formamidopyrimidine-DNA glycosylase n=1 Tax=Candidatus Nitronereus thalassa TaxID=3020898 RepID=A0ABU3K7B7_9BACT|nr:bifunctional DNA-formamidopyrimidine glycosylase/DNA-(apurinic or apyrimidinic site) lyase [Candidatus Nitronereus thalassa]MDT7042273.1 bifunctional DNA-formamidopyrimidine glycosylase/DNA-(apurinic or apyrimidinic site) lyase [Candidatus Nitronereus thalassa]